MFRLDSQNVYRSVALGELPWLAHGFGSRLSADWPDTAELATVRQIHSDRIRLAERPGWAGEGDALISNQPGLTLAVRTADCLPILIADPCHHAVAAIHAGWRGTAQEIAPKALQAMANHFGTRPEDAIVVIGPGIGGCCFEVGPEVAVQFAPFFPERSDLRDRVRIDLAETNRRQLRRNGVTLGQIVSSSLCSCCRKDQFHSYRRDREAAGRMVTTIRVA